MQTIRIAGRTVSQFILGSNPFSGISHQSLEADQEMLHYWTCARIKEAMREAERLGINTIIGRGDHHMTRVMLEYWDEGGKLQWFAQTCPELGPPGPVIRKMAAAGAAACHIHGGYADHLLAHGRLDELKPSADLARELGLAVGLAGHAPEVHRWAVEHLDVDYHLCSYYSPIPRTRSPEHQHGYAEQYLEEDRRAMAEVIRELPRPVIHYKVMAAGRNDPVEALTYVAQHLRPTDAVCVGVFTKHKPAMIEEDVRLLREAMAARPAGRAAS